MIEHLLRECPLLAEREQPVQLTARVIMLFSRLIFYIHGCIVCLFLTIGFAVQANAAIIITAIQSGPDVVFSSPGGSLDLTGLVPNSVQSTTLSNSWIAPSFPGFLIGEGNHPNLAVYAAYDGATLQSPFGAGDVTTTASSATGAGVGIHSVLGILVPDGYVSGNSIGPFSSTFAGQSIVSLGITPGTYVSEWVGDSITLQIQPVPIPSAVWLFGSSVGLLGWIYGLADDAISGRQEKLHILFRLQCAFLLIRRRVRSLPCRGNLSSS